MFSLIKMDVLIYLEHAPLTKTKITRPPAPWLKDLDINQLQKQRDFFRKRAHDTQLDSDWKLFRETRNELKKVSRQPSTISKNQLLLRKDQKRFGVPYTGFSTLTQKRLILMSKS